MRSVTAGLTNRFVHVFAVGALARCASDCARTVESTYCSEDFLAGVVVK
jgi:hypothetical protein